MEEESVNFVKGYGKVNPSDDETAVPTNRPPSRKRRTTTVVTVLLAVVVGATIAAAVFHQSHTKRSDSESSPPSLSAKAADSIRTVCSVTQHPDTCFTDISSIESGNVVDPEVIFNISLRLAVSELANISSLPKTLISKSNDLRTGSALRDCVTLFDEALSQLTKSVEAMRVGPGDGKKAVVLTEGKIGDLKTWISAAMTDQQTCVDGLEEMGSTAVDEVKVRMQRSTEYMSNSLAILSNLPTLLDKFGLGLH